MATHFIRRIRVHTTLQDEVPHAVMAVVLNGVLKSSLASLNGRHSTQSQCLDDCMLQPSIYSSCDT